MHARNRVEIRAKLIFDYLKMHRGRGYTIGELCRVLGIQDGSTTRAAIRRARDLATDAGLHFPPAVSGTAFKYMVTRKPGDAIKPMVQMARIEAGVRARRLDGETFVRARLDEIEDPAQREATRHTMSLLQVQRTANDAIQRVVDESMAALAPTQREQRRGR